MVRWTELWSNLQIVRLSYGKNRDQSFQLSDADNCWEPQPCHPVTCRHRWLKTNCKTQPPASNGWVALSSMFGCSFVCLSRIGNTSSHLHNMMFQTIQTIYFLWGYDPGNMSMSFIAELSPVYCCLVSTDITHDTWVDWCSLCQNPSQMLSAGWTAKWPEIRV